MSRNESSVGLELGIPSWPTATTNPVARSRTRPWAVAVFLLICGPLCFLGLGVTDVVTMEGIVADGARHMGRTQEYSVPHLHGEIYSYKPPLAYWMALASFQLFGEETAWTLRFPFALSALLMGLAILLLMRSIVGQWTGLLCAIASMTGALMLQKLHLAEFDMPLAAGVGIAVAVACRNFASDHPRGERWLVGYAALAMAFLAKGIPALMFYAPGLLLAALAIRKPKALLKPGHLAGVTLFAVVITGWFFSAFQSAGWQAFMQPMAEAHDKGLTWTAASFGSTLVKPLTAWALFLPWPLLLPMGLKAGWSSEPARKVAIVAASFVTTGIAVFMLVPATESRYLLPLAAPIGILCGVTAKEVIRSGRSFRTRAIEALAIVISSVAIGMAVITPTVDLTSRWVIAACATLLLVSFSRERLRRLPMWPVFLVSAMACLVWLGHTLWIKPHRANSRSLKPVADAFETHLNQSSKLWTGPVSKDFRHSSLFFYLERPVETFAREDTGPSAGDYVVLFSDEHRELMMKTPFAYEIVESLVHRQDEILLARVLPTRPALERVVASTKRRDAGAPSR